MYGVPPNTPTDFMLQFFASCERQGLLRGPDFLGWRAGPRRWGPEEGEADEPVGGEDEDQQVNGETDVPFEDPRLPGVQAGEPGALLLSLDTRTWRRSTAVPIPESTSLYCRSPTVTEDQGPPGASTSTELSTELGDGVPCHEDHLWTRGVGLQDIEEEEEDDNTEEVTVSLSYGLI